jgi:Flp pilus assembly protein TadG
MMLMPAAVLVVMVLGAMAVDLSIVHLGEREVSAAASAAVNDAVTAGLDQDAFYGTGTYALDPALVTDTIATSLAAQEQSGHHLRVVSGPHLSDADGDGAPDTVTIRVRMTVEYVFAKSIPGVADTTTVEAEATATAEAG